MTLWKAGLEGAGAAAGLAEPSGVASLGASAISVGGVTGVGAAVGGAPGSEGPEGAPPPHPMTIAATDRLKA